jgi:hypothetical protein
VVTSGRLPRRAAGFVTAAVTMAALAGCSTAPVATSGFDATDLDAALGKVPTDLSTVHGLDLPLDRSLLTPIEELEVVKARNTLMEHCLADHGLVFTFPGVDPVRDAAKPRRYGLVDAGEAAAYGYRDPAVFAAHGTDATAHRPPPDVVSVITGKVGGRDVPAGGCAGQADRTLATDAKPGQEPVSFALSGRSHEITRTAPPVTAVAEAWSQCMAAAGFRYARPDDAINDPAFAAGRAGRAHPAAHHRPAPRAGAQTAAARGDTRGQQPTMNRNWTSVHSSKGHP